MTKKPMTLNSSDPDPTDDNQSSIYSIRRGEGRCWERLRRLPSPGPPTPSMCLLDCLFEEELLSFRREPQQPSATHGRCAGSSRYEKSGEVFWFLNWFCFPLPLSDWLSAPCSLNWQEVPRIEIKTSFLSCFRVIFSYSLLSCWICYDCRGWIQKIMVKGALQQQQNRNMIFRIMVKVTLKCKRKWSRLEVSINSHEKSVILIFNIITSQDFSLIFMCTKALTFVTGLRSCKLTCCHHLKLEDCGHSM